MISKDLTTAALLLAALIPLQAANLYRSDFDTDPQWTAQSTYFTLAVGAVTATATLDSAGGTIDTTGTSTASSGLKLAVNGSAAAGIRTAGLEEANALATVQAAINKTLSGDNIIAIMKDGASGGDDCAQDTHNSEMVSIKKPCAPDAGNDLSLPPPARHPTLIHIYANPASPHHPLKTPSLAA